jgi:predicted nucleotidyltransferase
MAARALGEQVSSMRATTSLADVDTRALDAACRRLGLRRVVLFGSRATGAPPPDEESDLDLAISSDADRDHRWWEVHKALADVFPGEDLDVVDLADADPLFRWEIMREGVLLWGDEMDFLEFRAFAYRDFIDSADLRELEGVLFRKKMDHLRRLLHAPPAA